MRAAPRRAAPLTRRAANATRWSERDSCSLFATTATAPAARARSNCRVPFPPDCAFASSDRTKRNGQRNVHARTGGERRS
eukprot:351505-Chlamydomonas_euryale.AAC.2